MTLLEGFLNQNYDDKLDDSALTGALSIKVNVIKSGTEDNQVMQVKTAAPVIIPGPRFSSEWANYF